MMTTTTTAVQNLPEQRVTLNNVSWTTYESLLADHVDSSVPHFAYDQGMLEIVSPSTGHEETNRTLAMLVEVIAEELLINVRNVGSMTFKREDILRGFEPDTSFYIQSAPRVAGKVQLDAAVDPPPDLVIEIDVTSSSLNKLSIYAQMGIPEVWRYLPESDQVSILRLEEGAYAALNESPAFPSLTPDDLVRLVVASRSLQRIDWLKNVRAWVRAREVAPDRSGDE
ncbi:MAG: Uma2 family endonuclease [Chloroflexia bacterium]|nr:Uma2 family endonuclease [Chloroflexia bacterium]